MRSVWLPLSGRRVTAPVPDPKLWTLMVYAALILTAIPTLLVFNFCQNIILRGIVAPSEK